MRRYLLRIRPGTEEWLLLLEPPPRKRQQYERPAEPGWRAIPYVVVLEDLRMAGDGTGRMLGRPVFQYREHYRKAEEGLLELARQVQAANPTKWVDVLDVTEPALPAGRRGVRENAPACYRIVCRLEPQALIAEPAQESLLGPPTMGDLLGDG